jgi:lysophospholipase L1-like esterase
MNRTFFAASLLAVLGLASGCHSDDSLRPPPPPPLPSGGAIFLRYVALGNSITAGFQSAGINDSTQRRSYASLLAAAMGTTFSYPSLFGRGCPPPFTNNVTQSRVGGGTATTCDLRVSNSTPNNLAVPGARATEILSNFGVPASSSNALTLLFLGGRTQLEAMQDQRPTFVSLWIGNNDVLGSLTNSANPGNPALITPNALFTAQYDSITDAIAAFATAEAVLVGVADVTVIPYASSGATYWCLKTGACPGIPAAGFPPNFTVNNNCAPMAAIPSSKGDSVLVPWTVGVVRILTAAQPPFPATTVDCSVDSDVVLPAEFAALRNAVAGFNAHIQQVAANHGWAYFDPNPALLALRADPQKVAPFPDISQVSSGQPIRFGTMFTLDGVHPSSLAHRLIADSLASVINQSYGTTLPVPVCGSVTCPAP